MIVELNGFVPIKRHIKDWSEMWTKECIIDCDLGNTIIITQYW